MATDNQHVRYVLLAEFDIDKGASLKYQYPNETGTDEHVLSELMLPDGAHLRAEDWTIFCLNQTIPDLDKEQDIVANNNSKNNKDGEEKPLLYVLNLVRTKHDATARRGAHVKAMAICTRHQFLHIYKPVLLLAMEKYFENPCAEVLESLYKAVNSMDLSRMPNFSWHERQILRTSDDKSMFEEMFMEDPDKVISPTSTTGSDSMRWGGGGGASGSGEDCEDDESSRLRRGTFIDLASGREVLPSLGKDRRFFETKIEYEGIKLPIRVPLTVNDEEVGDFSLINLIRTFSPPAPQPGSPNPHHPHLDSAGPYTHPIMLLLNALLTQKRIIFLGYGHPSGEVANYVLAACALGSGCGTVLRGFTERAFPYTNLTSVDDLLKCPGFIAGVTNPTYEEHTAWWDVLCNIDTGKITVSKDIELTCPGGIHHSPYPFSSSIDSGNNNMSSNNNNNNNNNSSSSSSGSGSGADGNQQQQQQPFASLSSLGRSSTVNSLSNRVDDKAKERDVDAEFMNDVMAAVQGHYGEAHVRAKFQEYVGRFVRLAAVYEEEVYHQTKIVWPHDAEADPTGLLGRGFVFPDGMSRQKELAVYANRIEGWRQTISYRYYQKGFAWWIQNSTLSNVDVYRQVSKLKTLRNIPENEVIAILEALLQNIISDRAMIEFLSFLPQYQGGLSPLGLCLFHSSATVRRYTVELFSRLARNPTGHKFIQGMSRYQKITYERLVHEVA
ncbi:docking domain of Afi1 for Arf3 in vesicle trafficking-domain-containing protein [Zychaea mexicana]|uniref:docking domain of Afi1 for Arf3 in vesicle trafficking-domain-containing protein n=1 Tax=Zychaea mexicana TaxID=64656 RepID=UPI0022FE0292|nr:docking domain of Afi1 for Arf3 in vesicle trafficking-domain-containing protein [Zychaea mexicana]KAI9496916.1 docking domain of Afi1 for Arf3 in vesicle trafficking-domain-containing protein [Zychaea mexicana]